MNTLAHTPDVHAIRQCPESSRSLLDSVAAFGTIVLLLFCVLAFGAVEYWSVFILRSGSAILLLLWITGQVTHPARHVIVCPLYVPMTLWATIVAAQYVFGHTAYRYATFFEAMNFSAYGILFFIAVQCFDHGRILKRMATAFTVFGLMLACFAMIQEVTSQGRLYWLRTPQHGGSIYGPYVNHNHYAGLMEMLAPVSLALCLSTATGRFMRVLAGFSALLMAASLFLSGSRGGIVSFVVELLFLAAILRFSERQRAHREWRNLLCLCWLLLVLLLCMKATPVWTRISDLGHAYNDEVAGGRWTIARDSLRMWVQRPLLGWGLGTFPSAFPQFRSFHSDRITNQAHNDVLQIGVETGATGFCVMLTFCILLYRQGLRHPSLHNSMPSAIRLGALTGCTGLIVHSFADFNLHVPANAALFFFLCGIAASGTDARTSRDPVLQRGAQLESVHHAPHSAMGMPQQ